MTEQRIMDPIRVEDRALKKILRPTDFSREVAIPRAAVKRFPSNVSSLVRSASARYPTKGLDRQQNYLDKRLIMTDTNNPDQFKTIPIDIATLGDNATPKPPVSRGIGRSYSNRQVQSPAGFRRTTVPQPRPPSTANGGGSFLYSGNYDPNHPNQPIITKPVPLARSSSLNYKSAPPPPPPQQNNGRKLGNNNNAKNAAGSRNFSNRNPLAVGAAMIMEDEDEVDFINGDASKFDNWADEMFNDDNNNNNNNRRQGAAKVGVVPVPGNNKAGQKAGKQASNKASASPQQNWVLAGGPSAPTAGGAAVGGKKPGKKDMLQEMARDVAKDQAKEGLMALATEGGLDPGALGEDFVTGMGGKLVGKGVGKLGGKIGKKLGNEELGEELGEAIGDELGDMAADAAKDAAMDAIGDLAAGEGIDIAPPEIPDAGQLCAKCVIQ